MARTSPTGSRIRAYRLDTGLRQAELARACDISASYLNLIEHNRRRIGGALLLRIADALGVDPARLSGGAETRLATAMDAAAEAMPAAGAERDRAEDLAARFPGWAGLIAAQQAEIRRLRQVIERLNDRLTHDPFLSASMHIVLSSVTAIRSSSGILAQGGEIEPEWQSRFHRNIFEDSQRLTEAAEALVRYLDADPARDPTGALPQDEVDAWLAARSWRIEALEADPQTPLEKVLETAPQAPAARRLAARAAERYAADAARVPEDALTAALAEETDPALLAARFGADLPTVFRRLAALPADATPQGRGYGLVACDGAGALIFRKPLPGFDLPRYSAACPLWPLFEALRRPATPVSGLLAVAGGGEERFAAMAIAETGHPGGFSGPTVVQSWMLLQPVLAGEARGEVIRAGLSCRICAEAECPARREPSIFAPVGEATGADA